MVGGICRNSEASGCSPMAPYRSMAQKMDALRTSSSVWLSRGGNKGRSLPSALPVSGSARSTPTN